MGDHQNHGDSDWLPMPDTPDEPRSDIESNPSYNEFLSGLLSIKDLNTFIAFINDIPRYLQTFSAKVLIGILEHQITIDLNTKKKLRTILEEKILEYKMDAESFDSIVESYTGFTSFRVILRKVGVLKNWLQNRETPQELTIPEWNSLIWERYCLEESQTKFAFAIQVKTKFLINKNLLKDRLAQIKLLVKDEIKKNNSVSKKTELKIWNNLFTKKVLINEKSADKTVRDDHPLDRKIQEIEEGEDFFEIIDWPIKATSQTDILDLVRDRKLIVKKLTIVINPYTNQICFLFPHSIIDGQPASNLVNLLLNSTGIFESDSTSNSVPNQEQLRNNFEGKRSTIIELQLPVNNDNQTPRHNQITSMIKNITGSINCLKNRSATFQVAQTHVGGRLEPTLADTDPDIIRILTMLAQCGIPVGMSPLLSNSLGLKPTLNTQRIQVLSTAGVGANRVLDLIPTRSISKPSIVISSLGDIKSNNPNYIIEYKSTAGNTDTAIFIGYLYDSKTGQIKITLERDPVKIKDDEWVEIVAAFSNEVNWTYS